jgi:NADPH:quinone reductase-like Zn-dependent oxidoreductase
MGVMSKTLAVAAYGRPALFEVIERSAPAPGPGQATLRVEAASLNPYDLTIASGASDPDGAKLPLAMALEGAGVVTAVGEGAVDASEREVRVGDALYGTFAGAAAEEVTVATAGLFRRPAEVDAAEAAGLLLVGATAEHALVTVDVVVGDTVLVHGASGSVGSLVVQLALQRGATAVATAAVRHHERLRRYGAIPVVYGDGLVERVRELAPAGVTAAIDTVGTDEALAASVALLADPGRLVSIANFSGAVQEAGGRLIGSGPGADPGRELRAAARPKLAEALAAHTIEVPIARRFPLSAGADAYAFLADGHAGGKVIIEP